LVSSAVAGTLIPGAAQDPATAALLWGQDALGAADAAAQDLQHQASMLELKEKIKRETELLERIDGAHALKKDNNTCQAEDLINIRYILLIFLLQDLR
jgi:glycine/D-amino acid oxidase-like deaminating enzyme